MVVVSFYFAFYSLESVQVKLPTERTNAWTVAPRHVVHRIHHHILRHQRAHLRNLVDVDWEEVVHWLGRHVNVCCGVRGIDVETLGFWKNGIVQRMHVAEYWTTFDPQTASFLSLFVHRPEIARFFIIFRLINLIFSSSRNCLAFRGCFNSKLIQEFVWWRYKI